jgi:UDP-N-acetylmuramoylalanine--D-glutamate ligase
MNLQDLDKKLVAILGYGQEGKAVTAYLLKHGVSPVLFDQRPWESWGEIEKLGIKKLGLNFIFGPDAFKELVGFDVAFRSPGIRLSDLQHSTYNLQLTSQTKFFFENCPAKIIGVTGTKGKGTTSSLIYEILLAKGYKLNAKCYLTGNIGKTQPLEILDNLGSDDYVVYELSSFQLQDLEKSPHIAVVLMVTSEHLDYHTNQKDYVDAKSSITKFQTLDDFAIINADFENSVLIGEQSKGKKLYFSRKKYVLDFDGRQNQERGKTVEAFVENKEILTGNFHLSVSQLHLRGEHNFDNVMAAILATRSAGADLESIKKAVLNFKGLEHRLEFVAEKSGVKFYNDSFSTTPETAIAAMQSFTEPLIIILGGSSKNSDFTELGRAVNSRKNIKKVILIGREASRIKQSLGEDTNRIIEGAKNMEEIFKQIESVAESGDVVVLSPACASFDMFKSYVDRGNQFKHGAKSYSKC